MNTPGMWTPRTRFQAAAAGLCFGLPLMLAVLLTPDGRGFGTHRQLGLPACVFPELLGVRCPCCGVTTAGCHVVRGNWRAALSASATGTLLALTAATLAPWLVLSGCRGRWTPCRPPWEWAAVVMAVVLACEYAGRLWWSGNWIGH